MKYRTLPFRIHEPFLKKIRFFTLILILFSSCILLAGGFTFPPAVTGDGNEYVGMTISLLNHGTPDQRPQDLELKQTIYDANKLRLNLTHGYFTSLKGTQEGGHLWFYSLFVLPVFFLFHILSYNELVAFQIFNGLLIIITMIIIFKYDPVIKPKHFWYIAFLVSSPVLLYFHWTGAEVFSFCFVSLSLFFGFLSDNRNYYLAILCSSIASLQNPPIVFLTFSLVILGWRVYSYNLKKLLYLLLVSFISCTYYIYNFYFFHTFLLVLSYGASSLAYISWERVIGVFFDLNAGIITYMPLALILSVFLIPYSLFVRGDNRIILLWGIVLAMSIASATTSNWNYGMQSIFRYAVWMLPIFILIVVFISEYSTHYLVSLLLLLTLISSGMITTSCLLDYRNNTCFTFNSLSKEIMVVSPAFYNPEYEIFGERSISADSLNSMKKAFPVLVTYGQDTRKIFTNDENLDALKKMGFSIASDEFALVSLKGRGYINSGLNIFDLPINIKKIHVFARNFENTDIFDPSIQFIDYQFFAYSSGWGGLEDENETLIRWLENEGYVAVFSSKDEFAKLIFQAKSKVKNQTLEIYVGERFADKKDILPKISEYSVNISLKKGLNVICLSAPITHDSNKWRNKVPYSEIGFKKLSILFNTSGEVVQKIF